MYKWVAQIFLIILSVIQSFPVFAWNRDTAYYQNKSLRYVYVWSENKTKCEIKAWYENGSLITDAPCINKNGRFYPNGDIIIKFKNGKTAQEYNKAKGTLITYSKEDVLLKEIDLNPNDSIWHDLEYYDDGKPMKIEDFRADNTNNGLVISVENDEPYLSIREQAYGFIFHYREFYPDTKLMHEYQYINGALGSRMEKFYNPDGTPDTTTFIDKDFGKYGVFRSYYINKKQKDEARYFKGYKNGLEITWFENGQMSTYGNYKNGDAEGFQKMWDAKGNLISQYYWQYDKPWGHEVSFYPNGSLQTQGSRDIGIESYYDSLGNVEIE